MISQELIIDDIRRNPGSTRVQISERCGVAFSTVNHLIYRLIQDQIVGKSKIGHNQYRYFIIDDAISQKPIQDYQKPAIRSYVRIEQFKEDALPMISAFPGRSSAYYANMMGVNLRAMISRLKCLEKFGFIVGWKFNTKNNKKTLYLWYIKGQEPDKKELIKSREENKKPKEVIVDDDPWINEISKSREQRRLERLRAQDAQAPIPSYAEFFKRQEGRN